MSHGLRILLFVAVILLLVGLTAFYVHRRGSRVLGLGRRGRWALGAALVAAPLALVASRVFEASLPRALEFGLGAAGATVILGVWISTVLLGVVDLAYLAGSLVARARRLGREPDDVHGSAGSVDAAERGASIASGRAPDEPASITNGHAAEEPASVASGRAPDEATSGAPEHETMGALAGPRRLGRRDAIRRTATGAALSVGFGSAFYGALFGRHDYETNEVPIPIAGLSPRLDGYRIVQLSDVHFGVYVGDPELRSAVELVRRARPDVVVLTGDLLDHDAAAAPWLGRLVRGLEEIGARDGVVMIPGNHDYYAGIDVALGVAREAGAIVLRNQGRVIGGPGGAFGLVGVDDVWAQRNGFEGGPDLDRALAMVPSDLPKVLLCHNPVFFPEARGRVALQLSGHTHGGQVNLGVHPAELVLPYVHGLYEEAGSRLYVNRGFGTAGPPARVGAPPEVTVAILTAA